MAVAHSLLEIYCEALATAARRRQVGTRAAPPYSGVVAPSGSAGAEAILFETLERVREQLHDTRVAGV